MLTASDYLPYIDASDLATLQKGEADALTNAEETAKSVVTHALFQKYDTSAVFSATGSDRDRTILMHLVNIVLYMLYKKVPTSKKPEDIVADYEMTMRELDKVAQGKKPLALPRATNSESETSTRYKMSSDAKRSH